METVISGFVLGVVLLVSGIVLRRIAHSGATGGLSRNGAAGIRTKATMASDDAWLVAHQRAERPNRAAGSSFLAAGLASLAIATLLALGLMDESVGDPVLFATVLVGTVVGLIFGCYGCVVGNRAAVEVAEQ